MYRPKAIDELRVPLQLLKPTYVTHNGVRTPIYPPTGELIFVSWKTFGGTETTVNGVYSIRDTAHITTWYRPDITSDCHVKLQDGREYEIISEPENADMARQFCEFKVERVKGGA